jgi:hypothetical protein
MTEAEAKKKSIHLFQRWSEVAHANEKTVFSIKKVEKETIVGVVFSLQKLFFPIFVFFYTYEATKIKLSIFLQEENNVFSKKALFQLSSGNWWNNFKIESIKDEKNNNEVRKYENILFFSLLYLRLYILLRVPTQFFFYGNWFFFLVFASAAVRINRDFCGLNTSLTIKIFFYQIRWDKSITSKLQIYVCQTESKQ